MTFLTPSKYFALPQLIALLLISFVGSFPASAGTNQQFHIDIPTLDQGVTIDGHLDEVQWQKATSALLQYETSPGENIQAPVATQVKVFATETSLFVSFIAQDPDSNANTNLIRANITDRDSLWGDDLVGIKLDTFNDERLAYQFFVNPYGVQMDSIENELTGQESNAWDGIWHSSGRKTDEGYLVEMELPLRLFNFDSKLDIQTWGIEFIRFYPRDKSHRLSTHAIDRNNSCQLCQLGTATGLSGVESGQDLQLTPSLVMRRNSQRDLQPVDDWESDNTVEPGLDIRWGITPSTLLSATINPDFSQVEADAGQLDINSTFALFYPEKRAFFLDNKDYFDTQLQLLHTRNIVSPDYGVKLTSKLDNHTFAVMATNDTKTNFLVPGNLSSDIASIDEESYNLAGRYRADFGSQLSIGALMTAKQSDQYHNYVASGDIKYQPTTKDTFTAQYVASNTEYPEELYKTFCSEDDCLPDEQCEIGECGTNERVLRTNIDGEISDDFYRLKYVHENRNWVAFTQYESVGEDFRADLGFIDKVDVTKLVAGGGYTWYPLNSSFSRIELSGDWDISHNQAGEMIEQETEAKVELEASMQSYVAFGFVNRERVGRRHDSSTLAIEGNTQLFTENIGWLYFEFTPIREMRLELDADFGDSIDYANDRLGSQLFINPGIEWKITDSISLDLSHMYRTLDVDDGTLFTANLTDMRLNWYFNINNFIRISSIYTDIERDPNLYLYSTPKATEQRLGNEVLYGYKLNPQSVFYLGYSDGMRSNEQIDSLTRDEQTYFMKVSYAWLL
ncbi:carbohydrate binding family 9 domain-containing protein [Shewanella sp. UCD-KL12]|uniref:carbohydrate binding family 9 domain-containing protein n=1 Tax=Shewanella sp. UCD-KL12 TaxID=1917163 RepID=UPI00097068F7|nr:carbohydrate binding family 9 domain-containing protein [Shewanella sp. UCD-KL12]